MSASKPRRGRLSKYGEVGEVKHGEVLDARVPLFVAEYVANGGNGTQAAIKAGCPEPGAHVQAVRWLRTATIREEIEKVLRRKVERIDKRGDQVITELFRILSVDVAQVCTPDGALKPIHEIPEDVRRAISGIEIEEIWDWEGEGRERKKVQVGVLKKVKFWSKTESANLLGKHLKLWVEKAGLEAILFSDGEDVEMVVKITT